MKMQYFSFLGVMTHESYGCCLFNIYTTEVLFHFEHLDRAAKFHFNGFKVTNFEMETSALYSLSSMLGHQAVTVCAIIANRFAKTYSKDYGVPVEKLIKIVLDRL